jgi:ribosomal protein S18 acetylase RimI-like enzyme
MKIRQASGTDFNRIADIHLESWQDSYVDVMPADFLNGKLVPHLKQHWADVEIQSEDVVLVAEEKELIGFIAVWCRPTPFIDNLHVKPSHRSQNVGTALLTAAAEELLKKGKRTGFLWVFESNENAIRFYERLGGVKKERAMKNIFGYEVLIRKIEWDDLSTITYNLWTSPK